MATPSDTIPQPKWIPYCWNCAKHFGRNCYQTWREELAFTLIVLVVAYFLTRRADPRARADLQVALLSSMIALGLFSLYHFIRVPFLVYAEAMGRDSESILSYQYGVLGIFVLLSLVIGMVELGLRTYAALPATQVEIVVQAPNAPPIIEPTVRPQTNVAITSNQRVPALPAVLPAIQPATQLDSLRAINGRLTTADREQFAAALHDFSQALDQAAMLGGRVNQEGAMLNQDWQSGSIANDFRVHKATLLQITSSAKDFAKSFPQVREKWKYFSDQTNYIFGNNPDNQGPNALINAAEGYANYLDRWGTIPTKDQRPILDLLATEQNEYNAYLKTFSVWRLASESRLGEMRDSIR